MKKIATILSVALVAVACNRDNDPVAAAPVDAKSAGVVHYNPSDLPGSVQNLNESFSISAKAAGSQLNYTYRGYAKPVDNDATPFNSDDLSAAAIFAVDDVVFVCWHTNGNAGSPLNNTNAYGGSIAAYKLSGIGQYTFMDRVDFPEHDFFKMSAHKNTSTGNIEVFVAGQRNPDNSGYLLANHAGATVTRIDYDYINDEFWEPSFEELPLPGVAATDIIALAQHYFVLTGNGEGTNNGGIFEVNRSLDYVLKADQGNVEDGIALATDPSNLSTFSGDLYVLDRAGATYRVQKATGISSGATSTTFSSLSSHSDNTAGGSAISPINYERGDLAFAKGRWSAIGLTDSLILAVGSNGIFEAGSGAGGITAAVNNGACTGIAYDAGLGVMYYSAGEGGMWVLAMGEYAGNAGPLVSLYDNIGRFVPPSSVGGVAGPIPFNVKDISVYQTRHIALASGDGGVYFLQRDKN
jgi:hypothetical protein